ncbi:MAG: hypothetical protein RL117_126 [Verrucomicrobiota bacterium]|jgi:hypothetical protein
MKFVLALIGVGAAGVLGYLLEPSLRPLLTNQTPVATIPPAPAVAVEPEVVAEPKTPEWDYTQLQPHQLPAKITLKSAATATATGETDSLPLPAGTKVKPLRIEGFEVVFSVLGTAEGKIEVKQTDLVEQLIANPPPPAITTPEPMPEPEPEPEPEPAVAVAAEPTPEPKPEPEPMEEAEPAATAAPEPATPVATAPLGPDEIVQLMKTSLRSGQITEFKLEQVNDWKPGEEETIDGEPFQTGLATYQAETIFGTKNIQAKALIKGGKVVRWIWPTSGLEIQ